MPSGPRIDRTVEAEGKLGGVEAAGPASIDKWEGSSLQMPSAHCREA